MTPFNSKDIKPGDLCLAISSALSSPQICIAEKIYMKDSTFPFNSNFVFSVDAWMVDRLLDYKKVPGPTFPEEACKLIDAAYLVKIGRDDRDEEWYHQNKVYLDELQDIVLGY